MFSVTPCSLDTDALSLLSLEAMKIREELGVFKSPVALSFLQHQLISSIVTEAKVINEKGRDCQRSRKFQTERAIKKYWREGDLEVLVFPLIPLTFIN